MAHRSIAARLHAAASTSLEAEIQRRWNFRRWKCSAAVAALEALERILAPIREHVLANGLGPLTHGNKQMRHLFLTQDIELSALMVRTSRLSELGGAAVVVLAGRKQWKLITLGLALIGLALGARLRVLGQDAGLSNPIWMMWQVLPGTELINHHARAIPVALLPFVAVAATRVAQLRIAHQPFLLLLLGCELCLLSPNGDIFAINQQSPQLAVASTSANSWALAAPADVRARSLLSAAIVAATSAPATTMVVAQSARLPTDSS